MVLYQGFLEKYIIVICRQNILSKYKEKGSQFISLFIIMHLTWPFCNQNAITALFSFVTNAILASGYYLHKSPRLNLQQPVECNNIWLIHYIHNMVSMLVIKRNRTIHLATLTSAVIWEKLLLKSLEQIFTVKKLTFLKHGLIQCILLHLYILLQIPPSLLNYYCIFIQLEFGQQWARGWYEYDKQYWLCKPNTLPAYDS